MPGLHPDDRPDHVHALEVYARERLGLDVQAISRAGRLPSTGGATDVWDVMTEAGSFWLVERGGVVELFLATTVGRRRHASTHCSSPRQAVRRFWALHP